MIILICILAGIAWGIAAARKGQGNRLDMLQYAAAAGIAGALGGLLLTIVVERLLG
ncbi:hypothetical protein [Palleronia sp. LCG004]|uniref:hypothetical protein n=1 Tax=Palleronia sp. LCG004 TaxID=3079304 RepID=UPI00294372E2|nr:hypothetical protein [Palleronia sp. LCG004]WOI55177.1 hypothetical protein RVY76_08900 [Palleronia sp. LCG004]